MKTTLLVLFTSLSVSVIAQVDTAVEARVLFQKTYELTMAIYLDDFSMMLNSEGNECQKEAAEKLVDALYREAQSNYFYLIKTYPRTKYACEALYETAVISLHFDEDSAAKSALLEVVHFEGGASSTKNEAYMKLARIAMDEKDFKLALNYLEESQKYPNPTLCGTALIHRWKVFDQMKEECLSELNKKK